MKINPVGVGVGPGVGVDLFEKSVQIEGFRPFAGAALEAEKLEPERLLSICPDFRSMSSRYSFTSSSTAISS